MQTTKPAAPAKPEVVTSQEMASMTPAQHVETFVTRAKLLRWRYLMDASTASRAAQAPNFSREILGAALWRISQNVAYNAQDEARFAIECAQVHEMNLLTNPRP